RNCWKLELKAPNRQSQYSNVWLWVDKEGGALMKLEGYDWNGKLAKRFTVVSGQKIEDRWFLKQMRIEEFDPATGKQRARTYLEIMKQTLLKKAVSSRAAQTARDLSVAICAPPKNSASIDVGRDSFRGSN